MNHLENFNIIERELGFLYPGDFKLRLDELINLISSEAFSNFMPNGKLLSSIADVKIAYQENLPPYYLPFLLDQQQNDFTYYYVFEKIRNEKEIKVYVFGDHAIVMGWVDLNAFFEWLYENAQA